MTLEPNLLRACASYLKHAETYCLDGDDQMALLRETARIRRRPSGRATSGHRTQSPRAMPDVAIMPLSDAAADERTHAHLEAIREYASRALIGRCPRPEQDRVSAASAILDATPSMLEWWCVRLAPRTD